jgi:hypothetical protein
MNVKIMERLHVRNFYGLIKNIIEMIQTNNLKFSKKSPKVTLENYTYEGSEMFKVQILEIERKKCQAFSQTLVLPHAMGIIR